MIDDLQTLIENGESEHLEFKSSFGREAIETLSAFANTEGGAILIGVDDRGKIIGTKTQSWY